MMLVRLIRALIFVAILAVVAWGIGFTHFVAHVQSLDAAVMDADPAPVDAIVVLTGGSERVPTGVDMLVAGRAKKLFISGVYPGLTLDDVLAGRSLAAGMRGCCIVLGHAADSTLGNVEETQEWLALEGYHSLRLVTANYHMPRSLLLFRAAMPDVRIIPHPIAPDSVKLDNWWRHAGTVNLLATEYDKFLWVKILKGVGMP